ncbi:sugar transferase [Clostridium sp. 19966]|nr:sugar transferase [Clostridium sp. 19966]MDT8716153.1 sugar transferase [Clostridium sp. 19966]
MEKVLTAENLEMAFQKNKVYFAIKRSLDIIGSILGIIILSPVFLITFIAIKATSDGPAFFSQERVGMNGHIFKMYKFRSMIEDAESLLDSIIDKNEMTGPMFKMKEDPRLTKIGKFLRKTSIDELPQLFNVLKGEMSLVGPRPNLPREVERFNEEYKIKLIAKPGLTCYWQVMGRSSIGFEEWMRLDMKYIRERNTLVDLKLIFRTVLVFFGDKNAK